MSQQFSTVDYSDVHWFQTFDGTTYESDENTRPTSFENPMSDLFGKGKPAKPTATGLVIPMGRGWESRHGVPEVYELTAKQQKEAVAQRRKQIALWEESDNPTIVELAQTAKRVWGFVTATGKPAKNPRTPKMGGNMGFRRAYAIMGAIHVANYDDSESESYTYEIPIQVVDYESETERILAHVSENLQKTEGVSRYLPLDYVSIATKVVGSGGIESDLTRAGVKRGTAQKVYNFARLAGKFKNLNLVDRVMMDPPKLRKGAKRYPYSEGCFIPISVLDKEELRVLASGRKAKADKPEIQPASKADEVESYIASAMRGSTNTQDKMLPKDRVESIAESHDCEIVKLVCHAIRNGKTSTFEKLRKVADELNKATAPILEKL